ncbi:MAG: hypothetical protein L3K03_08965 [Thermoplasmata archaeon]|nr:hypothetical protein [Thermoplasmata archaeon]
MAKHLSSDLATMFRICERAHQAFRRADASPHRGDVVAQGASGAQTEELDRLVENEVVSALETEGVDWNLVSEEIGRVERGGALTLVVDPVDGSHNALRRLPFATISLALGARDLAGVQAGMIHDLSRGTTYWAELGGGAFRDGERIRTRPWVPKQEVLFLNLGRHATPRTVGWASAGRRVRSLGCASLEIAMVAQGGADVYSFENDVEERNLRVTDIAAAYRILGEAGGGLANARFESIDRFPLSLDQRTSVLAWGDAAWKVQSQSGAAP